MRRAPEHERHRERRLTAGRRPPVVASSFAAVLLLVAGVACTSPGDEPRSPSKVVEIDGAMPGLDVTTFDGEALTSEDLAGTPVLFNFWATWCDPCEREQPILVRAHEQADGEVAFVGVDVRDQDDAARRWISRYGVTYPNVADPFGSIAYRFGVTVGLPTTIVVDADGRLRYRVFGELDAATLEDLLRRVTDDA